MVIEDITESKIAEKKLKESEKRLSLIFNNTSDVQVLFKVEGDQLIYEATNQSTLDFISVISGKNFQEKDLLGLDRKNVLLSLGLSEEFIQGEDVHYRQAMDNLKATIYDNTFNLNGIPFFLETTLIPISNEYLKCTHILFSSKNITDRKMAEESLKKTKDQLQNIIASNPSVIYTSSPEGDFQISFIRLPGKNRKRPISFLKRLTAETGLSAKNCYQSINNGQSLIRGNG